MKTSVIIALVVLGVGLLFGGILTLWGVGTYNEAATLRNQYESKVKANEAVFDNMWKKISQSHQVTTQQRESLKSIFTEYAQARAGNGNGGAVMNWIKEALPKVNDISLFKNLVNIINGSRDEWTANQVALVSISQQYNLMLSTFPSAQFLGLFGFQKIDPKIITSTRTEAAFKSGKDDSVELK